LLDNQRRTNRAVRGTVIAPDDKKRSAGKRGFVRACTRRFGLPAGRQIPHFEVRSFTQNIECPNDKSVAVQDLLAGANEVKVLEHLWLIPCLFRVEVLQ
jgi:hypothetical protein